MRHPKQTDHILGEVLTKGLNHRTMVVFVAWLRHQHNYHPNQRQLANEAGVGQKAVSVAFEELREKQIVIGVGMYSRRNQYQLHPSVVEAVKGRIEELTLPLIDEVF